MERKICEECGGKIVKKEVEFKLYDERIGHFPAEVCEKCGEEVFDEKISERIDEAIKEKGLWGLETHAKVTQVGSSLALIINKRLSKFLDLEKGEEVHVYPENKKKLTIEIH